MRIRHGLLLTIGSGCVILGAVLVVTMIRPQNLSSLGTAELFVIVGLIVMPALTLLSVRHDRSVLKTVVSGGYQHSNPQVRVAHRAHDRGIRIVHHARTGDVGERPEPRSRADAV